MANRYWVGGTGNWSDATNHWSDTSNGTPNASYLPTSSDNVYFDANSGSGTVTIDATAYCLDFDASATSILTIAGSSDIYIYGSFTLETGMTWSHNEYIYFSATSTGITITTAGVTINSYIQFNGVGGEWTLQDDLEISGTFYLANGSFDANDHNVTANDFYFYAGTGYTPTVNMGSGTWEATNNGSDQDSSWYIDEGDGEIVTIYAETSTIKLSGGGSDPKVFYHYDDEGEDLGKTYNNIWITGGGTGVFTIQGSNTFNNFKIDAGLSIVFEIGKTTTVSTFTATGTSGNKITIKGEVSYKLLATSDAFDVSTITGSKTGYEIDFSGDNQIVLSDGKKYLVMFEYGNGNTTNYVKVAIDGSSPTHSGIGYFKISDFYSRSEDTCFDVFNTEDEIVDSYDVSNSDSNLNLAAYWKGGGQTFLGDGTTLGSARFYLTKNNSPIGNAYIKIYEIISQFNLSKASGIVKCDYLDLSNSNATGGATWYAGSHSVYTANNDGWLFDANDKRDARITGKNTANSERSARISGKNTANSERSARISGKVVSERNARITGKNTSDDNRSARVSGKLASNSERNAKITGIATTTDERDTRITGKSTANSTRNARITGVYIVNSERDARISGIDTLDDERDATIFGVYRDQDERGAKIWGQDVVVSYRAARIRGKRKTPWTKEISPTSVWGKRANPTSIWGKRANPTSIWTKEDNEL